MKVINQTISGYYKFDMPRVFGFRCGKNQKTFFIPLKKEVKPEAQTAVSKKSLGGR